MFKDWQRKNQIVMLKMADGDETKIAMIGCGGGDRQATMTSPTTAAPSRSYPMNNRVPRRATNETLIQLESSDNLVSSTNQQQQQQQRHRVDQLEHYQLHTLDEHNTSHDDNAAAATDDDDDAAVAGASDANNSSTRVVRFNRHLDSVTNPNCIV